MFQIGERVRTGVYVCGEFRPMVDGIIVAVHNGYCDVDVMSFRGGAPWVRSYTYGELRREEGRQR